MEGGARHWVRVGGGACVRLTHLSRPSRAPRPPSCVWSRPQRHAPLPARTPADLLPRLHRESEREEEREREEAECQIAG